MHQIRHTTPEAPHAPPAAGDAYYLQPTDDRRTLRWSFGIALAFHAVLLLIQLPELATAEPPPPPEKAVYVVEQVRFKPPPPPAERELPPLRTRIVPIPDPTPDDPEPIRPVAPVEPVLDLPPIDLLLDLPAGPPPEPPSGPLPVGGDVAAPVKLHAPAPRYPEMARRARITGTVIVQAVIDPRGEVVSAEIVKSLPLGLDQAALDAIRQWRFAPATLNGKPVAVFYNLTVTFDLN